MNILFNVAVSLIASAVIFVGGMNLPASNFSLSWLKTPLLGAFTEITTATNLADFPTTYNANLNKTIEVGTTSVASITTLAGLTTANALTSASSLATVGTITSGTWSGTAIAVGKGGTGTTSPSTYFVLLGNGANGLTIASTTGATGQFLTSNGAGAYPSWQTSSVNQTDDYNFTSSAFRVKNLHASSTVANPMVLNGVSYSTPTANAVGIARNNGSGVITWDTPVRYTYATTTAIVTAASAGAYATSTALNIPANVITASSTIHFSGRFSTTQGSNNSSTFYFRDMNGITYAQVDIEDTAASGGYSGVFDGLVQVGSSVSSQTSYARSWYRNGTASPVAQEEKTTSVNLANATSFVGVIGSAGGGTTLFSLFIEVNP